MVTSSAPQPFSPKAVAPWWHTAVLVVFFLFLTLAGIVFQFRAGPTAAVAPPHQNRSALYLSLIFGQWALFYYVWKVGLGRTGTKLSELIGGRWKSLRSILLDALLAAVLWLIWVLIQSAWDRVFGGADTASIRRLLPQQTSELIFWVALSLSAGFCEEVIFRG